MQKELIISTTPQETKLAILEDDELVEYTLSLHDALPIFGNIYKGKVTKVLPGMQSAFVDIGLERDAFLYVSDFFEDIEEYEKIVSSVEDEVAQLQESGRAKPGTAPSAAAAAPPAVIEEGVDAPAGTLIPPSVPEITAEAERPEPAAPPVHEDYSRRDRGERGRRDRDRRGQEAKKPSFYRKNFEPK